MKRERYFYATDNINIVCFPSKEQRRKWVRDYYLDRWTLTAKRAYQFINHADWRPLPDWADSFIQTAATFEETEAEVAAFLDWDFARAALSKLRMQADGDPLHRDDNAIRKAEFAVEKAREVYLDRYGFDGPSFRKLRLA